VQRRLSNAMVFVKTFVLLVFFVFQELRSGNHREQPTKSAVVQATTAMRWNCQLSTSRSVLVLLLPQPILLELAIQRRSTDPELACHIRQVAAVSPEGFFDGRFLELVQAHGHGDRR